jgi:hypothetical protein
MDGQMGAEHAVPILDIAAGAPARGRGKRASPVATDGQAARAGSARRDHVRSTAYHVAHEG